MNAKSALCVALGLNLFACGGGEPQSIANTQANNSDQSAECGKGGNACPAGLECVTFRGGQQACGPMAIDTLVLVSDATMGGSCLSPTDRDAYPGASISSISVIALDGSVKG